MKCRESQNEESFVRKDVLDMGKSFVKVRKTRKKLHNYGLIGRRTYGRSNVHNYGIIGRRTCGRSNVLENKNII